MSPFDFVNHALHPLEDSREPSNLRRYTPAPEVEYPCYACGEESTHEIIHRGSPLDVCDGCDIDGDGDDGAPYCSHCGAMKARYCKCGPIAENE